MKNCVFIICLTSANFLWFVAPISAASVQCHLHPPAAVNQEKAIPLKNTYPSYEACAKENGQHYSGLGRCHCAFGDAPWAQGKLREGNVSPGRTGDFEDGEMP